MTDERTTAYLLDELPEHEAQQFEDECFSQPEWPEIVESAEEDLIQAYIENELSPERRQRFEENYLTTPARKEKLLFAQAFPRVICEKRSWTQRVLSFLKSLVFSPESRVPRFAAILVTLGLGATLLLFFLRTTPPRTFAHLNLAMSHDTRAGGGRIQKVTLPLAEDALRVSLTFPESAPQGATYRVQWENKKAKIEDLAVEKQDANAISVIIPAAKLTPGQYTLKLFRKNPDGTEERVPGNYFFNVD